VSFDGRDYQAHFDRLAAHGVDVHGESTFVRRFTPSSVLDAGCGTGRVAIELARHGIDVVGVDVDASMIAEARRRAPQLSWEERDLTTLALDRRFDVVVMAGNVPLFTPSGSQDALVRSCGAHVAPEGVLVAGFQLDKGYSLADFDRSCDRAGLTLAERWSTWDLQPFVEGGSYAVSVVRRPMSPEI
jgi:2-polyprenyl-3-methyl-5-hydroxy-6-metoxy-1,4-benzoquinol methylase